MMRLRLLCSFEVELGRHYAAVQAALKQLWFRAPPSRLGSRKRLQKGKDRAGFGRVLVEYSPQNCWSLLNVAY